WADGPAPLPPVRVEPMPSLAEMAPMTRRRIDRLGRLACHVAYQSHQPAIDVPLVFASRYGDAERSLSLLGDLVRGEALSPTGFGLSVHNAVGALYGMARQDANHCVAVSAGRGTAAAAMVEAAGLLADGAPEALIVYYEAPLPSDYAVFHDEPPCEYAWAWRVAAAPAAETAVEGGILLRVACGATGASPDEHDATSAG